MSYFLGATDKKAQLKEAQRLLKIDAAKVDAKADALLRRGGVVDLPVIGVVSTPVVIGSLAVIVLGGVFLWKKAKL